ncbi:LacI family DNA-binding transcriptional regulator [Nocardioides sp. YIM 152588]|uniref:LacI family DNA-binding transcriptional regulator n=1 Tax=Nocardioides sp. YIM 152588 TaxID=3158259 RepID=UPI0032E3740F
MSARIRDPCRRSGRGARGGGGVLREPTMADIAAHLGVSRQLVSIVLRDMPGASEETRARVKEAARELGYRPHQGARMLRQYRRRQLGVTFSPSNATESDIVEAIYAAVEERGLQVVLSAQTRSRTTVQAVEELLGYRCAAMVLIGPELGTAAMADVAERAGVPVVAVAQGEEATAYDVVRSAGGSGIEKVVRHLLELGHRELTYVDAPAMPPSADRRSGYERAVAAAGLAADVVEIDGPDYTEEAGAEAGRRLLSRPHLPTGVLACNDQVAVGVLQVLSRAGVRVPGQVSLTGFDDSRVAALSSVDLTTLRQDPDEMGRAAVEAVLRRIDKPTALPEVHVVEPSLVVRSSTASPR